MSGESCFLQGRSEGPLGDRVLKKHLCGMDDGLDKEGSFNLYSSSISNVTQASDYGNGKSSLANLSLDDELYALSGQHSPEQASYGPQISRMVTSVLSSPSRSLVKDPAVHFYDDNFHQSTDFDKPFEDRKDESDILKGQYADLYIGNNEHQPQESMRYCSVLTSKGPVAKPNSETGRTETLRDKLLADGKKESPSESHVADKTPLAWDRSPKRAPKNKKEVVTSDKHQAAGRTSPGSKGSGNTSTSAQWKYGNNRNEEARSEPQYPVRPGLTDCQYYLKTGKCTYGARCKFNHPERDERLVTALNRRDCFDFVQTGKCPYGRNCKYNHPNRKEMAFLGLGNGSSSENGQTRIRTQSGPTNANSSSLKVPPSPKNSNPSGRGNITSSREESPNRTPVQTPKVHPAPAPNTPSQMSLPSPKMSIPDSPRDLQQSRSSGCANAREVVVQPGGNSRAWKTNLNSPSMFNEQRTAPSTPKGLAPTAPGSLAISGMTAPDLDSGSVSHGMNAFGFNTVVQSSSEKGMPFNPLYYRGAFQYEPSRREGSVVGRQESVNGGLTSFRNMKEEENLYYFDNSTRLHVAKGYQQF